MEKSLNLLDNQNISKDPVTETAFRAFGIRYLYPWQRLVIANILDAAEYTPEEQAEDTAYRGRQIVLLPTGAGKSFCFQVPALLLNGPTLVIYPLLALIADQKRRLTERGIGCVIFRGNQSREEREHNFKELDTGVRIILANPEVLQNDMLVNRLANCHIAHAAIDEAHCISEWGDSFRPAYLTLGTILEKLHVPVITAFTATASPEVLNRIAEVLFHGEAHIVRSESDRPNIHYAVHYAAAKSEAALLRAQTEKRPMIIFCGTRVRAEDMARTINTCCGMETARFYHAGLQKNEKTNTEQWFFHQTNAILCATCAYGMGVDKHDIRTVIHLDPPATAEAYIQEAGRGGRDGKKAHAILLWNSADSVAFSKYDSADRRFTMKKFAETTVCRRQILLEALDATEANEAVCSGCDLCDERNGIIIPETGKNDEQIVYNFIRKHRKYYSPSELSSVLIPLLNEKMPADGGLRIWTYKSVASIITQLTETGKIQICGFPQKGKVTTAGQTEKKASILPFLLQKKLMMYYLLKNHLHPFFQTRRKQRFHQSLASEQNEQHEVSVV